ncbi:MAG TPA: hypothetical protein VHV83_03935, partial [Armatimonadota bacterium]|nr:hypothetical protein [Armatimonadota bacterium]
MIDLRELIDTVKATVHAHQLDGAGTYSRWLWQNSAKDRDLALNPYGCADAANIYYTIGQFPAVPTERAAWISTLRAMQDPNSGLFTEPTHHPFHTTAHCTAALELFDARPLFAPHAMMSLLAKSTLEKFLDGLEWVHAPWQESHKGAGLYAALVLTGQTTSEWEDWYFAWLWNAADPITGFWRKDSVQAADAKPLFHHLAGSFHYLFNHEYARRPLRYPERMVDSCLDMYRQRLYPSLGHTMGFAEIDWVFCSNRALRQCGHRFAESKQALRDFAAEYTDYLFSI